MVGIAASGVPAEEEVAGAARRRAAALAARDEAALRQLMHPGLQLRLTQTWVRTPPGWRCRARHASPAGLDGTVTDAERTLRPMTAAEFEEWLPRNIAEYGEHIAASGAMPLAAAREKAARDTARSFGAGFDTPGQYLFRVLAGEVAVGWLWLSMPGPGTETLMAWVSQIEIAPQYRGRGYGRAAMLLAENEARARGMVSLGLNVHGQNTIARSLYGSLGYQPMSLQLKKAL